MLNPDFREFFKSLNVNKVRYLVVGGYAVAFHGYPRYTKDLDIWIDRTPTNAARLVKAVTILASAGSAFRKRIASIPIRLSSWGTHPTELT